MTKTIKILKKHDILDGFKSKGKRVLYLKDQVKEYEVEEIRDKILAICEYLGITLINDCVRRSKYQVKKKVSEKK